MAASHFLSEWMALPVESFTSDGHIIAGYINVVKNKCSQIQKKIYFIIFAGLQFQDPVLSCGRIGR